MRAHLQAMADSLAPLGYPVFKVWADDEALGDLPYLVLEVASAGGPAEDALDDVSVSLHTAVRVKAVAGTPDGVLAVLSRVRGSWSPSGAWSSLTVPGRVARVHYERSEFVGVDRDFKIPGSDSRHPAYGVDTYTLSSEPA